MPDRNMNLSESVNWSPVRWEEWIEELVNRRCATFINEPSEMIAAYGRESKVSLSKFLANLREVFTAAEKSETVIIFYSGAVLPTIGV